MSSTSAAAGQAEGQAGAVGEGEGEAANRKQKAQEHNRRKKRYEPSSSSLPSTPHAHPRAHSVPPGLALACACRRSWPVPRFARAASCCLHTPGPARARARAQQGAPALTASRGVPARRRRKERGWAKLVDVLKTIPASLRPSRRELAASAAEHESWDWAKVPKDVDPMNSLTNERAAVRGQRKRDQALGFARILHRMFDETKPMVLVDFGQCTLAPPPLTPHPCTTTTAATTATITTTTTTCFKERERERERRGVGEKKTGLLVSDFVGGRVQPGRHTTRQAALTGALAMSPWSHVTPLWCRLGLGQPDAPARVALSKLEVGPCRSAPVRAHGRLNGPRARCRARALRRTHARTHAPVVRRVCAGARNTKSK